MKLRLPDPGAVLFGFIAEGIKRLRQRRRAKRRLRELGIPEEGVMDLSAVKGAAKSKLVWLGVAQVAYGLFQLWVTGTLSPESAGPVVSGALTVVLRALTNESLANKGS
jgi:hypothetical protein